MRRDALVKLSASFFVLVMALSALAVMPVKSVGETPGTNDIYVPVMGESLLPVPDATVTLTNVHTGVTVDAPYSSGVYFVAEDAPSGYYRVDVVADEYYDSLGADWFPFNGLASHVTAAVTLTPFPAKEYTWNVTLSPMEKNAKVGFYDGDMREVVSEGLTNQLGYVVLSMFDTTDPDVAGHTFYLFVQASGYVTYYEEVDVTGNDPAKSVTLTKSKQVIGFVNTGDGLAKEVVAYMLDKDPSLPWIARLMKSGPALGSYRFDAVANHEYWLCVDAYDASADIRTLSVGTSNIVEPVNLDPQVQRTEEVSLVFDEDYQAFNLTLTTVWSYDNTFPGLLYSDVGSLRMQLDLNGDADGTLDSDEVLDLQLNLMNEYGPQVISTKGFLVVNESLTEDGTIYVSGPLTDFDFDLSAGPIDSEVGIVYGYACTYEAYVPSEADPPPADSPSYKMDLYPRADDPEVDYVYTLDLMPGYELVSNMTSDEDMFVGGYTVVTVDPASTSVWGEKVGLIVEESARPSAGAGIDDSPAVYAVTDEGGNITKYIVKVGTAVQLTANDSADPNGNPLEFTWLFDDGTGSVTTTEFYVNHTYSAAGVVTVNLTVTDVALLTNWTEMEVVCDARNPVPVLTVKDREVNVTENSIRVNESEMVWFNATSSEDGAVTDGDDLGMIDWVEFDYGDGSTSGRVFWDDPEQNVSHAYQDAGTYNVTLNVTDVVGHWKNTTLVVQVNDTSPPTPAFTVKNETWGSTLVENKTLTFDANDTRDNVDNYTLMTYNWDFGDDTPWDNTTGYNTTHVYQKIGKFLVTVNVTDLSGNYKVYSKWITISPSPRPDVTIGDVWFDPEAFVEGAGSQYIMVNLTNSGSAVATNITVTFYIVDDTDKVIGSTKVLLNGTTTVTSLDVGDTAQVKFAWSPDAKGTYTIKVTVTSDGQLVTHSTTDIVDVEEAGWKKYALWGGVLGVLILVPLFFYMRGRWSKREKKGPRREKKSSSED